MNDTERIQIDVVPVDGSLIVRVAGEIDFATKGALLDVCMELLENHPRQALMLDTSAVTFMDSQGISALVTLASAAGPTRVAVRNPSRGVRRVLEIAGCTFLLEERSAQVDP